MTAKRSADGESPSASSTFLPQFRRSRRASIASLSSTSQIGKEVLAETLDQIHNAASQSDTLTTFNEYTTPPSSSAATETKGITSELQGGLSGLYSRLRASVGNVKDSTSTASDENIEEDASTKSLLFAPSPTPTRQTFDGVQSSNTSVLSGGTGHVITGDRQNMQEKLSAEGKLQERAWKQKPLHLSAGMVSRGSSASNIALRSPVGVPVAAAAAKLAVAEVNVNAVKDRDTIVQIDGGNQKATKVSLKPFVESRIEAQLSGATVQSGSLSIGETKVSPSVVSKPVMSGSATTATPEPSQKLSGNRDNVQAALPSPAGVSQDASYHRVPSGPDSHETLKTQKSLNASASWEAEPRKSAGPGAAEASTPESIVMSKTNPDSPSANLKHRGYQNIDLPLPKAIGPQFSSQSRTPDVSLTRTSSDATAPTLIHASRHRYSTQDRNSGFSEEFPGRAQPKGSRSTNAGLPPIRNKVLSREYWMRDENAKDCFYCGDPFSTFRRKHHCSKYRSMLSTPICRFVDAFQEHVVRFLMRSVLLYFLDLPLANQGRYVFANNAKAY